MMIDRKSIRVSLAGRPIFRRVALLGWAAALLVLASAAAPAARCRADEPAAAGRADYLAGLDALAADRLSEAQAALSRAIEADSENPDYYLARGVAQVVAEKLPGAMKDLERALRLKRNDPLARLWLATAVAMTGDFARDAEIYPFATHDLDESRLRKASKEYGEPLFRRNRLGEEVPGAAAQQAAALREIKAGARWFVGRMKAQPGLAGSLLELARARVDRGEYAAALPDLDAALATAAVDPEVLFYHATCLVHLGHLEPARVELTRALTARTDHAGAYAVRALVLARLGDLRQAQTDLATARRLGLPADDKQLALAQRELASAPRVAASPTLDELIALAESGASDEELTAAAVALRKANNGRRLRSDQVYQDRLRELEEAVRARPRNAQAVLALGQFLFNESTVRRERVGPRGAYRQYRYQTPESQKLEVARAESLADEVLALDPKQVDALTLKARTRMWNAQYADGEALLRRALELRPKSAEILELFAEVLEVAAAQKHAEAAELRRPKFLGSYDDRVGDYIYTYSYYHYPSAAERAEADALDAQAQLLVEEARGHIQKAIQLQRGTPLGRYLEGLLAWQTGDLPAARAHYEEAVRLEPQNVRWSFNLAGIYAALGLDEEATRQRIVATNLVESTAAPLLNLCWQHIAATRWKTAREVLQRAAQCDDADSRVPAYLGVVQSGDEKPAQALACYRAALALEEARCRLAGTTRADGGNGPFQPDDEGLALAVRLRAAAVATELGRFELARDLALAAVAAEQRIARDQVALEVPSTLLPDPDLDPEVVPEAENVMALFAWARVAAGAAHNQLGQPRPAIAVLEPILRYEALMTNGVGLDRLRKPTLYADVELARAYLALGDIDRAQSYAQLLPRKRFGVGPSKGPYPELEEIGSQLLEEIARARGGRPATGAAPGRPLPAADDAPGDGDNSAEGNFPAGGKPAAVAAALRKIGTAIGHPELGGGGRVAYRDAADAQLCATVEQAVAVILAPQSNRWRQQVVMMLALIDETKAQFDQQIALWQRRLDQSAGRTPARSGQNSPAEMLKSLAARAATIEKASGLLIALAVEAGYPAEALKRDLAAARQERGGFRGR